MRRRTVVAALAFVLVFAIAEADPVLRLAAVGLTVADMDRSVDFYTEVLRFTKLSEREDWGEEVERRTGVFGARTRVVRLRLGDEALELTEFLAPRGRPAPVDVRSNDRWFQHVAIIVSDMDAAYAALRRRGVQHASPAPQRLPDWNPNAGGIEAFYFKDPDAHPLEILEFPEGKGDPKWHGHAGDGRLFLGIDHTAIVVEDTEASLDFYREELGLRVAGQSENYGPEQERLNNVFGARLRITGLRAPEGPGIELLEYVTPRDGRPMPVDERANDLVHWQTHLVVEDVDALARELRGAGVRFVSFAPHALLARDPDGHVMLFTEISGAR